MFGGSDDDEPDFDDFAEYRLDPGVLDFLPQRRRRNYGDRYASRDNYFFEILERVSEEENKAVALTEENEEQLFDKIRMHLEKPFVYLGILTLQKLAFLPSSVSVDRLKEIAKIICRNVFNPLSVSEDYVKGYADFCKGFAYLSGSTQQGVKFSFEQILISEFLFELPKKFNYSQRLIRLLENRDIPEHKKRKWLDKQLKEQERVFQTITNKSVKFLDQLFQLYPEIVYRVTELLLRIINETGGEDALQYLCELLENVRYRNDSLGTYVLTDIHQMKLTHWERNQQRVIPRQIPHPELVQKESLTPLLARITNLSNLSYRLYQQQKDAIQSLLIGGNPYPGNTPQDFIKYCIKDCIHFEKLKPEDDLKIDDESEFDSSIYTLRSKNFVSPGNMHFWRGLQVKILTKLSSNPQQKFGSRRGKPYAFGRQ